MTSEANDPRTSTVLVGGLLVTLLVGGGCSPAGSYRAAQDWQRQQCVRLPDADERERCLESRETSYEAYRRAREEALEDGADDVR